MNPSKTQRSTQKSIKTCELKTDGNKQTETIVNATSLHKNTFDAAVVKDAFSTSVKNCYLKCVGVIFACNTNFWVAGIMK